MEKCSFTPASAKLAFSLLLPFALAQHCRNAFDWPFSAKSIWNSPLGSDAQFVPAEIFTTEKPPPNYFRHDAVYILSTQATDPIVPWYNQGHWGKPDSPEAYCNLTGPVIDHVHFPSSLNFTNFGGNNFAALVKPDGRSVFYPHPLYVCEPGGPLLSMLADDNGPGEQAADLYLDNGTLGCIFGSGLNPMAPSLRRGQLLPGAPPISHALCLEFFAFDYYWKPQNASHTDCFKWPAVQCDHHERSCDPLVPGTNPLSCYNGSNPLFRPGALLALPPQALPALNASLATAPARRLLEALAHYGAYVCANSAGAVNFLTEWGVAEEFEAAYGFPFDVRWTPNSTSPWAADILLLLQALHIVANNGPDSVGGGGLPTMPPPPPLCPPP
jgi:hypothetical protein